MKLFILGAFCALSLLAQDAKLAPPQSQPATTLSGLTTNLISTGHVLTEIQSLRLQLLTAKILLIQNKYKIDDYQTEVKPVLDEQHELTVEVCRLVGIAPEAIPTQCAFDLGIGQDGKPRIGPDGKAIEPRVWKAIQAPSPAVVPQNTPPAK